MGNEHGIKKIPCRVLGFGSIKKTGIIRNLSDYGNTVSRANRTYMYIIIVRVSFPYDRLPVFSCSNDTSAYGSILLIIHNKSGTSIPLQSDIDIPGFKIFGLVIRELVVVGCNLPPHITSFYIIPDAILRIIHRDITRRRSGHLDIVHSVARVLNEGEIGGVDIVCLVLRR